MSLQDFRGQGPPADIGTHIFSESIIVFQFTFSGTTYTAAVRMGQRAWVLVSYGTAGFTVLATAINTATAKKIFVANMTLTMASFADRINITNTDVWIEGIGESTVLRYPANAGAQNIWMFRNMANLDSVAIKNITFDLNNVANYATSIPLAFDMSGVFGGAAFTVQRLKLENLRFINTTEAVNADSNIAMDRVVNLKVTNCHLTGAFFIGVPTGGEYYTVTGVDMNRAALGTAGYSPCGFKADGTPRSIVFTGCNVRFPSGSTANNPNNIAYGFLIYARNTRLQGCYAFGGSNGILYQTNGQGHIVGCEASEAWDCNIQAAGGKGVVIIGCRSYLGMGPGIMFSNGATNCIVCGCVCYNNGQADNFPGVPTGAGYRDGIRLDTNVTDCLVCVNMCYDDQGVRTQAYGIREVTNCDYNWIGSNILRNNLTGPLIVVGVHTLVMFNSGYNPQGFAIATPAVPASTVWQTNTFTFPIRLYIVTIGAVTSYEIRDPAGTSQVITTILFAGMEITLDPQAAIRFTYTGAPTWKWYGT